MYNGFTTTTEQDRARWELMQRRAAAIDAAKNTGQVGETQPAPQRNAKP